MANSLAPTRMMTDAQAVLVAALDTAQAVIPELDAAGYRVQGVIGNDHATPLIAIDPPAIPPNGVMARWRTEYPRYTKTCWFARWGVAVLVWITLEPKQRPH